MEPRYLFTRISFCVIGLISLCGSYVFLSSEYGYWKGTYIFVGKGRYLISFGFGIMGILFIIYGLKKNIKPIPLFGNVYFKCIGCGAVISESDAKSSQCPKCGDVLEELKGFFERHPDKKR